MKYGRSVPMRCMDVHLGAHAQQVPPDAFAQVHFQSGKVAKDTTVDAVHEVALNIFVVFIFVEDHEEIDEFPIDIVGGAVRIRVLGIRNDHGTEKAGVDVADGVDVRMINPHD